MVVFERKGIVYRYDMNGEVVEKVKAEELAKRIDQQLIKKQAPKVDPEVAEVPTNPAPADDPVGPGR